MITSDHGEALGARNQLGHGGVSVYQNEVNVPLLVKYPGVNPEARVNAEASQVDLLPTVLEAASIAGNRLVCRESACARSKRTLLDLSSAFPIRSRGCRR
jgi:arylsulfatase A-like enzyme